MKTITVAAGLAGLVAAGGAFAGAENVKFPADYLKFQLYQTLDRHDNKQYRELFTQPHVIEAVKAGKPIPSGAVIMLVQWSTH